MHFPSTLVQLIAVSIAAHVALAGSRVTTALYALSLQASELTVGVLLALFAFFPMLLAVPLGRLIDRTGIRRPMLIGCTSLSVGCLLPVLADGLNVLYGAVVLIGTGFMTVHIGAQHAVGAIGPPERRAANFSWLSLGFSVSSLTGPVLAGFLIDHVRFSVAYAVFCGFSVVALGFVAAGTLGKLSGRSSHASPALAVDRSGSSAMQLLRDPELRRVYVVGILLAAAWDLFTFVTPIQGSKLGFSASTIGLILGAFSAATFAVRLAMPAISRHWSEWQVLTGTLIVSALCYVAFPFMRDPLSMSVIAIGLGLALGSSQPNILSLLHHSAPPGRIGEAIGIRATIGNASQVLLPVAFGAAGAALGLFAVFWGVGVLLGTGVPLAWRKASGR